MTLPDLITLLEGAEGPIFETERLITEVTGYPNCYRQADGTIPGNATVPNFTASIEAAMALAIHLFDDGAVDVEVAYRSYAGGKSLGRAEICGPRAYGKARAKTPALALVLASLRALSANQSEDRT